MKPPDVLFGEYFPPEPRQKRSQRTREALLASALANFERAGYEATTIDQIASDAGIAVGAFYLHFRSKRQALLVLMDRWIAEIAAFGSAEESPVATVRAGIAAMVRSALRLDAVYLGAYRAWHELRQRDSEIAARHVLFDAWCSGRVAVMLQMLSFAPGTRRVDIPTTALVINGLFWRLMEMRVTHDEAVVATTIDLVTRMLLEDDVATDGRTNEATVHDDSADEGDDEPVNDGTDTGRT